MSVTRKESLVVVDVSLWTLPSYVLVLVILLHSLFLLEMEMLKMVTPQLQATKKWRIYRNFQASPEDQGVFSSQRALPLMETK